MVKHFDNNMNFDEEIKGRVLVDFYAEWCGPCKMMSPILDDITGIDVLKVDVDEFSDIASNYGIMSIPTLMIFEDGKDIKKSVGLISKTDLEDFIK